MTRTDQSVKNICIAAIKRKTMQPYNFEATEFYDEASKETYLDRILSLVLLNNEELPIAATHTGSDWTLVTTQRVITFINNELQQIALAEVKEFSPGHFKDRTPIIHGILSGINNQRIPCLIETGRASMVIIYAIRTAIALR